MSAPVQWQIGDVVRLASGGPAMTVTGEAEDEGGDVRCAWFQLGDPGEVCVADFPAGALCKVTS
jgi:uncharacterized protein YodC (DUF2158 family)